MLLGESLAKAGSYLEAALAVGLLKNSTSNGLNLVSAPAAAKQAGIKVQQEFPNTYVGVHSVVVDLRTSMRVVAGSNPAQTDVISAVVRSSFRLSSSLQDNRK